jgi:hypothetical protein
VDTQQKSVELRFRQGEYADLFARVLRGDDKEGLRQGPGFAFDTDLTFLHRFQQGALRLWAGAVDLVGEHHLGEYRPGMKGETAGLALS